MRGLSWTIFLACLASPIGVAGVQSHSEAAVREALEEFVSAWKAGDADRLAEVVAEHEGTS